ncbi:MAG: helix-turn-helix domain-containing protein [Chloroflexota bacterium]
MSAAEAARLLGLSATRIGYYITSRRLPAERVGRQWIIRRSDVENFRTRERRPGRPPKTPGADQTAGGADAK